MEFGIQIVFVLISALAACSRTAALVPSKAIHELLRILGVRNRFIVRRLAGLVAIVVLWLASMIVVLPPGDERIDPSERISRIERELDLVFRETLGPGFFGFRCREFGRFPSAHGIVCPNSVSVPPPVGDPLDYANDRP